MVEKIEFSRKLYRQTIITQRFKYSRNTVVLYIHANKVLNTLTSQ